MRVNRIGQVVAWLFPAIVLAGCQPEYADPIFVESDAGYAIEYAKDECPFEVEPGVAVSCGVMTVPENRNDVDGPTVDIVVAILHSTGADPRPDPVLYLEGGPGNSALAYAGDWLTSPILAQRDIILFDQRGTGFSWPNLDCEETDAYDAGDYGDFDTRLDAVEVCRQRLRDLGVDLAQYNSAASAADVHDLRQALGIDSWNLYGISYGTRLALTVLRDFPDGVRSVVIDSVYPPNVNAYVEDGRNGIDAILALLDGCAADAACARTFPDLDVGFLNALEALDDAPLLVDEEGYLLENATVDDDDAYEYASADVVDTLIDLLYDTASIPYLPLAISGLAEGDAALWFDAIEGGEYEEFADAGIFFDEETDAFLEEISDSQGMFYSVECYEEVTFGDLEMAADLVADAPAVLADPAMDDLQETYAACDLWPAGRAAAREAEPVFSTVPALIMSGEYDPITPPKWGDVAAETLPNSLHVVLPRGGHGVSIANTCTQGIVVAFLDDPAAVPETSCVAASALPFVVDPADLD